MTFYWGQIAAEAKFKIFSTEGPLPHAPAALVGLRWVPTRESFAQCWYQIGDWEEEKAFSSSGGNILEVFSCKYLRKRWKNPLEHARRTPWWLPWDLCMWPLMVLIEHLAGSSRGAPWLPKIQSVLSWLGRCQNIVVRKNRLQATIWRVQEGNSYRFS